MGVKEVGGWGEGKARSEVGVLQGTKGVRRRLTGVNGKHNL